MPDYSSRFKITLVRHVTPIEQDTPVGKFIVEEDYKQYQVFIEGPEVKTVDKKLWVGIIGEQPGANFCPISYFYQFPTSLGDWIEAEAKKLHGKASDKKRVDVPPPIPE